jgi:hypothetical protein
VGRWVTHEPSLGEPQVSIDTAESRRDRAKDIAGHRLHAADRDLPLSF